MSGTYSKVKTVITGGTILAADRNSEHDNHITNADFSGLGDYSANVTEMQTTTDPYPAASESLATDGAGELERLRYLIAQITGESQWYIDPDGSLAGVFTNAVTLAGAKTFSSDVTIDNASATTGLIINNTATDGDPYIQWQLSGTAIFTMGVDDGDSDSFKIGTTAIGTSTRLVINSSGQILVDQLSSNSTPDISWQDDPDTGFSLASAANINVVIAGSQKALFNGQLNLARGSAANPSLCDLSDIDSGLNFTAGAINSYIGASQQTSITASGFGSKTHLPFTDNTYTSGSASFRWSDLRSVLVNGADYGFMNGWFIREYPSTFKDIQTHDEKWFREKANKGLQIVNDRGRLVMVIGEDSTLYVDDVKPISELNKMVRKRNISSKSDISYEKKKRKQIRMGVAA